MISVIALSPLKTVYLMFVGFDSPQTPPRAVFQSGVSCISPFRNIIAPIPSTVLLQNHAEFGSGQGWLLDVSRLSEDLPVSRYLRSPGRLGSHRD